MEDKWREYEEAKKKLEELDPVAYEQNLAELVRELGV